MSFRVALAKPMISVSEAKLRQSYITRVTFQSVYAHKGYAAARELLLDIHDSRVDRHTIPVLAFASLPNKSFSCSREEGISYMHTMRSTFAKLLTDLEMLSSSQVPPGAYMCMHTLSLGEAVCITVLHCSPVIPILLMCSDYDQRLLLTLGH
jgi:hypothetical protein